MNLPMEKNMPLSLHHLDGTGSTQSSEDYLKRKVILVQKNLTVSNSFVISYNRHCEPGLCVCVYVCMYVCGQFHHAIVWCDVNDYMKFENLLFLAVEQNISRNHSYNHTNTKAF